MKTLTVRSILITLALLFGVESYGSGTCTNPCTPGGVNIMGNTTLCIGQPLSLTASNSEPGGSYSFDWYQCSGPTCTLIASSTNTLSINSVTLADAGQYRVIGTCSGNTCPPPGSGCCISQDFTITVPNPTVTVTPSALCVSSSSQTLTATSGFSTYNWYHNNAIVNGAMSNTLIVAPANQTGSYFATVSDNNGCPAQSNNATFETLKVSIVLSSGTPCTGSGDTTTICNGTQLQATIAYTGTGTVTYQWSNSSGPISGATDSSYTPTADGTYQVVATDGVCTSTSNSLNVAVCPAGQSCNTCGVTLTAGSGCPTTVTATATPSGAQSYSFSFAGINPGSENQAGNTATATVSNSGIVVVTVTVTFADSSTCAASTFIDVTVSSQSATITADINPVSAGVWQICAGRSLILTASQLGSSSSYLWSTGETTQSITVSPTKATNQYFVTVTDTSTGCIATGTATVNVVPNPIATITGSVSPIDTSCPLTWKICEGTSLTLTAHPDTGVTYSWTGSTTSTQSSITVSPTVGTYNYTSTVTDTNGCLSSATATVEVVARPTVSIDGFPTAGSTAVCQGNALELCAAPSDPSQAYTYNWLFNGVPTGITSQCYSITNAVAANIGSYSVKITDGNKCVSDASPAVTVAVPACSITKSSDVSTVAPAGPVTYTLTVTGTANGAFEFIDPIPVQFTPGTPTISQGTATCTTSGNTVKCDGTVDLTGKATIKIPVTAKTTGLSCPSTAVSNIAYLLTPIMSQASANVTINVPKPTQPSITGTTSACLGSPISLTANTTQTTALSYAWSRVANPTPSQIIGTAPTYSVSAAAMSDLGNYYVTVTDCNGCSSTSVAYTVTQASGPTVSVAQGTSISLCAGQQLFLCATVTGNNPNGPFSYSWTGSNSFSSSSQCILLPSLAAGSYTFSVAATDRNGCTGQATTVSVNVTNCLTIVKTAAKSCNDGFPFSFVITVTNRGTTDITNPIVVTDPLPSCLQKISLSDPSKYGWSFTPSGNTVTATLPGLKAGKSASFVINATPKKCSSIITNTATVSSCGFPSSSSTVKVQDNFIG